MSRQQPTHLVLEYRPSQPTGWPGPSPAEVGRTVGGHHSSEEFELAGRRYRIALVAFGQRPNSRDPVYESVPADTTIAFGRTLERKFGAYYSFRWRGGFRGQREFSVQCYSVFAKPQQVGIGAELYVVYDPDVQAGDPPGDAQVGWIQVARWSGSGAPSRASFVDDSARPNPFSMTGGLISIFGTRVVNFDNMVGAGSSQGSGSDRVLPVGYLAEAFLARDTLTKDAAGKDVVEIYGGIKYGWQLHEVPR
jgi:hypothetical protein